jgi:hypothetical protein
MPDTLAKPVGLRGRIQPVANLASDQDKIISRLAKIPQKSGGKQEDWTVPPLSGPDGSCPQVLADAIWDFQSFWKDRGVFHVIDGVVDPGMHTWQQLLQLTGEAPASFDEYRVPSFSMYALPQDSEDTCWAACAAMPLAVRRRRRLSEEDVLTDPYLTMYQNQTALTLPQTEACYRGLGYTKSTIDLASRPAFVQFIRQRAPIIVASSIGVNQYHVRLIIGYWGYPASANEDDLQIRIYDPLPFPGFMPETPFLFSHFRYQMGLNLGTVSGIVGTCWYL